MPGDSTAAFAFVSELAKEVSTGKVELPSFPDVAVRVRKVLADEARLQRADRAHRRLRCRPRRARADARELGGVESHRPRRRAT